MKFMKFAVAVVTCAVPISSWIAPAVADVVWSCPSYDSREPVDKQVRPGVIVQTTYAYSSPRYNAYTINSDGTKDSIYIESHPSSYPLVAVWQNGTSCTGQDFARNAWAVAPDGKVFTDSGYSGPPAGNYGDMFGRQLNRPIVGMSPTGSGRGYWLVASDGGMFSFGDATFHGSMGNATLNQPITGMSVTPTGGGYWLVAADGGIFAFDAPFYGSTGHLNLNRPIMGMTTTPSGHGYWMVADDGGIFAFGDAPFKGSTGNQTLSAPIAGMVPNGGGYTLIGQDGQLYPFQ